MDKTVPHKELDKIRGFMSIYKGPVFVSDLTDADITTYAKAIINKAEKASRRFRAYDILSITFICDMFGLPEDEVQKVLAENPNYEPSEYVIEFAELEKYVVCKIILHLAENRPNDISYCGDNLFLIKPVQILVEKWAWRKILCKRKSTKSKMALGKQCKQGAEVLPNHTSRRAGRHARRWRRECRPSCRDTLRGRGQPTARSANMSSS